MNKVVLLMLLGILVPLVVFANKNVDEKVDEKVEKKGYYDTKVEPERKKSFDEQVSLNRDWYGRENPDKYPFNGFFPVWPAMLLGLSGLL